MGWQGSEGLVEQMFPRLSREWWRQIKPLGYASGMDAVRDDRPVETALALSKISHEAVEAVGLPDLAAQWKARIDRGELTDRVAARLIAVGAVYPSDALVWLAANRLAFAQSSAMSVRLVIDDEELDGHGIVLNGTIAETLGRNSDVPVETASLLVGLLDRQHA